MKEAMEELEGAKMGEHQIQAVRFADDQAMTASTAEGIQTIMTILDMRSWKDSRRESTRARQK